MSLIPLPLHPGTVLTESPFLAGEPHGPGFPAGAEKKMVLIDSPSAATWTQFAAPGGGVGGSGAVGRNQKQMGAGILGPGTCRHTQQNYPRARQPAGCQAACRLLGLCRAEHQAQAAHPVLGTWATSSARLSQGRCSSLAEMLKQEDLEGKEVVFPVESIPCRRQQAVNHLPGSAGSPGATACCLAVAAAQSRGRWSRAPGREGEGAGWWGWRAVGSLAASTRLDTGRAPGNRRAS